MSENKTKVQASANLILPKTVDDLKAVLEAAAIPGGATITARVTPGDRPWESGYSTLEFRWEKEV